MIITKDDREIELMTEAGRIVALVHEKLKEVIVPGITTNEIDQICDKIIRGNMVQHLPFYIFMVFQIVYVLQLMKL